VNEFRELLLIMISTPVYALLIGIELALSFIHNKRYYSTKGLFTNVYLSALNFGLDVLLRVFCLGVLNYFFQFHLFTIQNVILYWIVLLIAEDFLYYILHYADHYCRLFWAVHVTHHSSEEFNLTVGFRSSVFQPLYRFIYFIPLSLCGFEGIDIMFMYAATQIYGILIHTQYVGKLGILENFMATPSHHRVHHGSNIKYLDKNMGMVFIFWDKLFGTFQSEEETVKYGLTQNIESHHPVKVIFHEWKSMLEDLKKPSSFRVKLMYIFGPPGWSHDGSKKTSTQLRAELDEQEYIPPTL